MTKPIATKFDTVTHWPAAPWPSVVL